MAGSSCSGARRGLSGCSAVRPLGLPWGVWGRAGAPRPQSAPFERGPHRGLWVPGCGAAGSSRSGGAVGTGHGARKRSVGLDVGSSISCRWHVVVSTSSLRVLRVTWPGSPPDSPAPWASSACHCGGDPEPGPPATGSPLGFPQATYQAGGRHPCGVRCPRGYACILTGPHRPALSEGCWM